MISSPKIHLVREHRFTLSINAVRVAALRISLKSVGTVLNVAIQQRKRGRIAFLFYKSMNSKAINQILDKKIKIY